MSAATAILTKKEGKENKENSATDAVQESVQTFISWEDFQQTYLTREDGVKYEWLNGIVEQTPYTMEKSQLLIQRNLLAMFRTLLIEEKIEGELIAEGDLFFAGHHRRPDLCWLTDEQLNNLSDHKEEVPAFVIEIISSNDVMNKVVKKMENYRAANVQVVWHIFPNEKQVHVYAGTKLKQMTVCKEGDICAASPVLDSFNIAVLDIFKKIEKKKADA